MECLNQSKDLIIWKIKKFDQFVKFNTIQKNLLNNGPPKQAAIAIL